MSRFRRFRVMLDGQQIDRIRNGQTLEYPITAGRHTLQVGIDWVESEPFVFECTAGETVEFECGHPPADWKAALRPANLVSTVFLRRVESRK